MRFPSDTLATGDMEPTYSFFVRQYHSPIGQIDLGAHPAALRGGVNIAINLVHDTASSSSMPAANAPIQAQFSADGKTILFPARPNPFDGSMELSFRLAQSGDIVFEVLDLQGRRVALLHEGFATSGEHAYRFDGNQLSAGMYLCRLMTGQQVLSQRMMRVN